MTDVAGARPHTPDMAAGDVSFVDAGCKATPDGYDVVRCGGASPHSSLPLFLPKSVRYDPATNEVSQNPDYDDREGGENGGDGEDLYLVPNAGFDMLRGVNSPVGCVSCVGPYRTGKSLLLSRFLGDSGSFRLGPTLEGCTRGIWISTSALVESNPAQHTAPTYHFLLDCEGTGDPLEGSETSNARIALASILISSVFLYNNTGRPDRGSLQFLSYLGAVRKRIPSLSSGNFPAFLWVFRDFFLQLPQRKVGGKGKKAKKGTAYTLQEYMLERVLVKQGRGNPSDVEDGIVDSLLNDFRTFDVRSVGQPRMEGGRPFSPEELSRLDEVPWEDFDEGFRSDVGGTIELALSRAGPFRLGGDGPGDSGPVAHGPLYAAWCERVAGLVNSDGVLPSLPGLKQQLVSRHVDEKVEAGLADYSERMEEYLEGLPQYSSGSLGGGLDGGLVAALPPALSAFPPPGDLGVAETATMMDFSAAAVQGICDRIASELPSDSARAEAVQRIRTLCVEDESSLLARLLEDNAWRSRETCDVLARDLYSVFRSSVRNEETDMTEEQFEREADALESRFRATGRGPAVAETAEGFLTEQREADRIFLARVNQVNSLYRDMSEKKEQLDRDVEEKAALLTNMQQQLMETQKAHTEEMSRIETKTQEDMKKLSAEHAQELEDAMEEQRKREQENIDRLKDDIALKMEKAEEMRRADLEKKAEEMKQMKIDAAQRLEEEIKAREERLRRETAAHENQIELLMAKADEKMKKEIRAAEEKRKSDLERFQKDMYAKLQVAEDNMNSEVQAREQRMKEEEERHRKDMERMRLELNKKMEEQKKKYLEEIQALEQQCINLKACTIM